MLPLTYFCWCELSANTNHALAPPYAKINSIVSPGSVRKVIDWVLVKFSTNQGRITIWYYSIQKRRGKPSSTVCEESTVPIKIISIYQFPENENISPITDEDNLGPSKYFTTINSGVQRRSCF